MEIESPDNLRKFWLWRCNLLFIQHPEEGLIPERYKGNYRVSSHPFTHDYLPWTSADGVSCLVLEQISTDELSCGLHKIKVLIPNLPFDENGRQVFPADPSVKFDFFCYDLHDHFHDLRGHNRESQLHLVALLAAVNRDTYIKGLFLTPLQYAIKVLKTCFSNRPLTAGEVGKLKNILTIGSCQQSVSLILMVDALIGISRELGESKVKLPFESGCDCADFYNSSEYRDVVERSKNIYEWKIRDGSLPYR